MKNMIYACIILHNMIIEGKQHTYQNYIDYDNEDYDMSTNEVSLGAYPNFKSTYLQRKANVRHKEKHCQMKANLVEHIYECFRKQNNAINFM
ncbi:hypothetical protein JHK87_055694 [Glycine soja]|nr:hypothetical protein JHK87_055694 [Glycine soja]